MVCAVVMMIWVFLRTKIIDTRRCRHKPTNTKFNFWRAAPPAATDEALRFFGNVQHKKNIIILSNWAWWQICICTQIAKVEESPCFHFIQKANQVHEPWRRWRKIITEKKVESKRIRVNWIALCIWMYLLFLGIKRATSFLNLRKKKKGLETCRKIIWYENLFKKSVYHAMLLVAESNKKMRSVLHNITLRCWII